MNKMYSNQCSEYLCKYVNLVKETVLRVSFKFTTLAIFCFIVLVPMYGNIYQSPNYYTFVHPYNDPMYANYSILNRSELTIDLTEEARIPSLCPDAVFNTATNNSSFPINVSLSGFDKGTYKFSLWLNKTQIVTQEARYWESDPITFSTTEMSYGLHELKIKVAKNDTLTIVDSAYNITVMELNTVFQNPFGDEIHVIHMLPDNYQFGGIALFVEGFDVSFGTASDFMSNLANRWHNAGLNDCTIALLKLAKPMRDARDNSMSVLAATRFIYQYYTYTEQRLSEGVRLFGFSMGGVLSRYALSFAEENSIEHYCVQYISLDAPHKGAGLNHGLQSMISNMDGFLHSGPQSLFVPASKKDLVRAVMNKMKSVVAKQLIRKNNWATPSGHTYVSGSTNYLDLFSEINEEDRSVYLPHLSVLNSDPSFINQKPGFPYKQNRIRSMSYANGSLFQSGSGTTNSVLADYDIDVFIFHSDYTAHHQDYDKQPGSVMDEYLPQHNDGGTGFDLDFTQNYAPVIVPTKSSLYLKTTSVDGTNTSDSQFEISNYNNIVSGQGLPINQYLSKFTYFDKIFYAPDPVNAQRVVGSVNLSGRDWNWIHGNSLIDNLSSATQWSKDLRNRATTIISGTMTASDLSGISINAYIEGSGIQIPLSSEFDHVRADGTWEVPFTLLTTAELKIVFSKDGFVPTVKKVWVIYNHQSGSASQPSSIPVALHQFSYQSIRVAQSGIGSFTTISDALDFVYALTDSPEYNNENIRIIVFPGNYNENLWVRIPSGGISSLEIRGTNGTQEQTTISGGSHSLTRAITVQGNNLLGSFILRDIILAGYSMPGGIVCYNNIGNVLIDNCIIKDFVVPIGYPMSGLYEFYNGIAIQSFAPTTIRRSKIFNNQGVFTQDPNLWDDQGNYYSSMGAVALASDSVIEECELYNNRAAIAGAIVLFGQNHIVRNNRIFSNRSLDPASDALVIRCNNTSGTIIIHNEFYDNGCEPNYLTSGAVVWLNSGTINNRSLVANNTFHNNMSGLPPNANYPSDLIAIHVEGDSHLKISNNIITKYPISIRNNGQLSSNSIIKNCLFWQNATNFMGSPYDVTVNPGSCFFTDPQTTEDYRPIWNTNTKSPCIDNGDPDLNANGIPWYLDPEDQDPDGTRKDIGSYHNPVQHINGYHRLNNYEVKYICISGVENHPGNQGRNTLQYVFDEYNNNDLFNIVNPILERISWIYNSDGSNASPDYIPTHYVHSQNGYKVKLLFGETLEKDIVYSGFYPGCSLNLGMYHAELNDYSTKHFITAPDQSDGNCRIDPNTGVLFRETYLGYYLPESLKPFDALLPILDDIKAILAEDWALVRIPIFGYDPQPGDPPSAYYTDLWLGSYLMNNENLAINHGEMVVVHYIGTNDVEFKLGGNNPNPPFTDSYTREMTKLFTYEEQLDYLPVFISMDLNQYEDGNKPTEIALFIDEVCKGAAVINNGEIQLNAYITNNDDLSDDLKEVEFRLYFPTKSANSIVPEYAVLNLQTGIYESKTARVSDFKGFLRVQLTKTGEVLPPAATQLFQNYPNPFNPVTSIKYDLAENSQVRMDIFNVRGQLVKTLLNQEMLSGTHSVIWDGKDGQGRSVSSGVYFYRMSLPNKVLTNKMLLMK